MRRTREDYRAAKELGICVRCGKRPAEPDRVHCAVCLEYHRENRRAAYRKDPEPFKRARRERTAERKLLGLCISCGEPLDDRRHTRCPACRYIAGTYERKQRTSEQIEADKEKFRDRRWRLKQLGLCVVCGYRPATKGETMCEYCKAKQHNRSEKRRRAAGEIPNDIRWDGHRCGQCLSPDVLPGKKLCAKCYEMKLRCLERAKEARQERKGDDVLHPFLQQEQGNDRQKERV